MSKFKTLKRMLPFTDSGVSEHRNKKSRLISAIYCFVMFIFFAYCAVLSFIQAPWNITFWIMSIGAVIVFTLAVRLLLMALQHSPTTATTDNPECDEAKPHPQSSKTENPSEKENIEM